MNEEVNNNYNNTPDYNYGKENNGVKALLVVLIVLVLCLIGLTAYKMLVFDKKNDNKKDNNVVDNSTDTNTGKDNEKEKLENVSITDNEIQKYYNYVSAKNLIAQSNYDFNYFNENKNEIAFDAIIKDNQKVIKNCSDYDIMINSNNPNFVYICYTDDQWDQNCESSFNKEPSAKVNVLSEKQLKEAVEQIYGKNSYLAGTFSSKKGHTYQYINSKNEYIELTNCGGGASARYKSELYLAEKNSNSMILYEKITGTTMSDVETQKISIKHTFEKNTYDDNYHYVKSEKAE